MTDPYLVHIWPDGDYAVSDKDFFVECGHKSDDYETIDLNDHEAIRAYHDQPTIRSIIEDLM